MPDTFHRAHTIRRMWIRCGILVLVGLVLMASWHVRARRKLVKLDQQLAALDLQEQIAKRKSEKAAEGRIQKLTRSKQRTVHDRVKTPVPTTSVMALVAEVMPPAMGLTSFSLVAEPVKPASVKAKKTRRSPKSAPSQHLAPMRLVMEGVAPSDLSIAKFIGHMDERLLFVNVELAFSRPVKRDSLTAREFQVTAEIPLDRTYRLESGRKVSRAD